MSSMNASSRMLSILNSELNKENQVSTADTNAMLPSRHPLPLKKGDSNDDDHEMPWERHDFIPMMPSGKQRSPNMIRSELQKYIDASHETQTAIVERMGVNNNSFRRFMNPKTYKDQWSATNNGTYWAAARLLEQERYEKKLKAKAAKKLKGNLKKRTATEANVAAAATTTTKQVLGEHQTSSTSSNKRTKLQETKQAAQDYMDRINAVELPATSIHPHSRQVIVHDSCPEMVKKIKSFLSNTPGLTKKGFCQALGNINQNSLSNFLLGKKQDQCGNITYRRAYEFFEKKRILDQTPKSKQRLKSEQERSMGYSLVKERALGKFFCYM